MNPKPILCLIALLPALLLALLSNSIVRSQENPLGVFADQSDVGSPLHAGHTTYDARNEEYTIEGAGTNMWANRDEFHFVWRRLKGNFILTTRAAFARKGVEPHRKLGWIVRSSLDPDSPHAVAVVHGDGLTSLQFRKTKGAVTEEITAKVRAAEVLQLERKGNTYTMSAARFGDVLTSETVSLELGEDVYVG